MGRPKVLTGSMEERFWKNTDKRGPDDCWEWQSTRIRGTYGMLYTGSGKKQVLAHRFSWELATGRPPGAGKVIHHSCNNKGCVNPSHLVEGTQRDNVIAAHADGLTRPARGSRHPHAKLTEDAVREIRAARAAGIPLAQLAARFGVSVRVVYEAAVGITWKHVK